MCLSLIMTAARLGAHTLNYTEVISLLHKEVDGNSVVCGAKVRDKISCKFKAGSLAAETLLSCGLFQRSTLLSIYIWVCCVYA